MEVFANFDICHRMVLLLKLYNVTLTYFLNPHFLMFIFETLIDIAKMNRTTLEIWILQQMISLRDLHLMTLTYFFKFKIVKF